MTKYRFYIPYKRTEDWWDSSGTGRWHQIASWCNDNIGMVPKWEYIDQTFLFTTEEDAAFFKLRWI